MTQLRGAKEGPSHLLRRDVALPERSPSASVDYAYLSGSVGLHRSNPSASYSCSFGLCSAYLVHLRPFGDRRGWAAGVGPLALPRSLSALSPVCNCLLHSFVLCINQKFNKKLVHLRGPEDKCAGSPQLF